MTDLKVLSTHAVVEVLAELVPAFERAKACRLSFSYGPSAATKREIEAGAAFDVAIMTRAAIDELVARGIMLREGSANLARCGLGVSVRKGAPRPAMRDKIIVGPAGRIAELVVRGEGELAVQQVPELVPVKGADFVGPWPEALQVYTDFAAGISAASNQRETAQAFIAALAAPANAALYQAKGLEPIV
jgi:molybdate transport system substrate-binding protein